MKPPFPEFTPKDEDPNIRQKADGLEPPALFEPDGVEADEEPQSISRLRDVPFRMLVPNLITLGAICSGLTGIRMAFEGRFELAVVAIVFAAILDALDGRVARFLQSSSSFGEQLDSLADFVNFGVTPAIIVYMWGLQDLRALGWAAALVFAICGCLRLARFNVMLEAPNQPSWHVDFFTGVPAPAGALLCLLPVYLGLLGVEPGGAVSGAVVLYVLFVGFLMASNIPTWSGKRAGARVSRRWVVPVMLGLILSIVLLFSYPWTVLTVVCLAYIATLPFSVMDYRKRETQSS